MDGSKYCWEQADERAEQINFKKRSEYIQYLVEKDIDGKKKDYRFIDIVIMCILFVILLLFIWLGVL